MESYVYSNGTGNAVMTKTQAEPHPDTPTTPRWVGTGRTVLNNKGNVVKQYEPYFSSNHHFETEAAIVENGVTPIFHYDPLGRNIKTNFPDGTLTKIEFTPWQQKTYDQNDTILESQWYTAAQAGSTAQQRAAQISAPHANTPQVVDFDTLGRPFKTTDDNAAEGKYTVHQTLDIAGRPVVITDAKGRTMTTHQMGMVNPLQTNNIDSGSRWQLTDVAGKPLYMWDSRNHQIKHTYDQLQRPTLVTLGDLSALVVEKTEYGTDSTKNNIGQAQFHYDQSGKTEIESYDFKGNPLKTIKQFCEDYQNTIDWNAAPTLQTETLETEFTYDALNRPVTQTLPDSSVQTNTYNKAGLLETVAKDSFLFVTNINYNEKGQREAIYYGNGSKTRYYYNPLNFKLTRMLTTRNTGQDILQDLNYTYDPVGNIVEVVDNAQQIHYFSNSVIEPRGLYEYDALYRLTKAQGREKSGIANAPTNADLSFDIPLPNTGTNCMENFTQLFEYDQLGNILSMASQGKWLRNYVYDTNTNQLLKHDPQQTLPDYTYDQHGNITSMPGIEEMQWNHNDLMKKTQSGTVTTYYTYGSSGERARKVSEKQGGLREERLYVGVYEVYRKFQNNVLVTERTTTHISDDKSRIALTEKLTIDNEIPVTTTEIVRYQYSNHLGSASLELDENALIISYEEYHPFGTTSYHSGNNETEVKRKRYRYVGKERDEETGLYNYGFRMYAPWLGRFISVDPLQHDYPYYTPFQYAGNKPITFIDLDGLEEAESSILQNQNRINDQTPSEAKKNIYIFIGNQKEIDEFFQDDRGNNGTFYQIVETDLWEASKKLNAYLGKEKAENVVISTHGGPGKLAISKGKPVNYLSIMNYIDDKDTKMSQDTNVNQYYNRAIYGLESISNSIIKNGNLVFAGCNAGACSSNEMEGVLLGEALRKITGDRLNIFLNQDVSVRHFDIITDEGTKYFEFGGKDIPIKGTFDKDIRITGPLTQEKSYSKGWIQIPPKSQQIELRKNNENKGILYLNAFKNQNAITIK